MERMLIVIFDNETQAYQGSRALKELDAEGSITCHAAAVIQKNADGTVSVKQQEDDLPVRTFGGTAIGALIGLLGGPVGLGIGAVVGALSGMIADLNVAGVNTDFLDGASRALVPGKYAVVANISEEWVTPVDSRMEALGGFVFRSSRRVVEQDQRARDEAELRAEIEALKVERARAHAERKAKLQTKIDQLNAKLQSKLEQDERHREQLKRETEAKVHALEQKAAKAQGDAKAAMNARMKQLREQYEQSETKLRRAAAGQLRRAAAHIEKGKSA